MLRKFFSKFFYSKNKVGAAKGLRRHKKNAALVCAAFGFPVYNLMKSFEPVVNVSAASLLIVAVIFH
jgi:hypothetical protein